MNGWAENFKKILESRGIPASVTTKTGYFSAQEVVTVLNYLRILDNPLQDIPFAGVLLNLPDAFTMEELAKISRVVKKVIPDAPHQTLLVLDATTGQNAVSQAKNFGEIVPLTGVVLTKLDGTAKGGVVLSIYEELHVPVKWIGLGEREDDLERFNAKDFAKALFETTDHASGESTKV